MIDLFRTVVSYKVRKRQTLVFKKIYPPASVKLSMKTLNYMTPKQKLQYFSVVIAS